MYLDNKYTRTYFSLITKAKSRNFKSRKEAKASLGYVERHHIIPKSIGGTDSKSNLIYLTAKEHFICHLLLTKMPTNDLDKDKMIFAALCMKNLKNEYTRHRYTSSSRLFQRMRERASKILSEKEMPWKGKVSHVKGKTKEDTDSIARAAETRSKNKYSYNSTSKTWTITNVLSGEVCTVDRLSKWAEDNGFKLHSIEFSAQTGNIHSNFHITSLDKPKEIPDFTRWVIVDSNNTSTIIDSFGDWCKKQGINYNTAFKYYKRGWEINGHIVKKMTRDEIISAYWKIN